MTGHKVRVVRRGGGHVAQCVAGGCPAITGVWDTNAEARQSLSLQAHEEAPGAVPAAAEGKDTETNTYERPESMTTITTPTTMRDVSTYAPVLLPRDESIPATQFVRVGAQNRFSRASYRVLVVPALQEIRVRALHDEAYARQGTANIATRILRGETFGTALDEWSPTRIDGQEALVAIITAHRDGFQCERLGCVKLGEWQLLDVNEVLEPGENCICTAAATPLMDEFNLEVMWEGRRDRWEVIVDDYMALSPTEARRFATALQEASQIAAVRNREAARA